MSGGQRASRFDEEYSQGLARMALSLAAAVICLYAWVQSPTAADAARPFLATIVVGIYAVAACGWTVLVGRHPGVFVSRRVAAIAGDIGMTTFGTFMLGPLGAGFYPLYLWIIVGNGMRYGQRYLYGALASGIVGFGVVLIGDPLWRRQLPTGLGLLVGMVALPLFYARLIRRMHRLNGELLEERSNLLRAREQMHELATRDSLTRLLNRGTILERLAEELESARRNRRPLTVLMCDLDHFKRVNDTFGHPTGDAVLAEATSRLMSTLRPYDLAGRYGGEEFIVVLPGVDRDSALACAERLRQAISATPVAAPFAPVNVTCSFGVMTSSDCSHVSVESLMHGADAALYEAKRLGRNRVHESRAAVSEAVEPRGSVVTH